MFITTDKIAEYDSEEKEHILYNGLEDIYIDKIQSFRSRDESEKAQEATLRELYTAKIASYTRVRWALITPHWASRTPQNAFLTPLGYKELSITAHKERMFAIIRENQRPLEIGELVEWTTAVAKNMDFHEHPKTGHRSLFVPGQPQWGLQKGELIGFYKMGRMYAQVIWAGDLEPSLVPLDCIKRYKINR